MAKIILARFAPIPAPKTEAKGKAKIVKPQPVQPVTVGKAIDVMSEAHPAYAAFILWLGGKEATKRQARKFCRVMGLERVAPQTRGAAA
ncbi:MAG: hypothetical protein M0R80_28715 [Proteobacteria bacterium]|jgi:hypothetical protein|nr:hypothetical protein [Pseudomonadota bacterium]